jgi:hypothetical protein
MRLNSLKEGEIVKITHPGSYDYERNYMLVVWPEKLNYIFSTKNEDGNTIKCYEADSIFVINLEGKLFVNGHFGYDTDCIVEKISTKEYKESKTSLARMIAPVSIFIISFSSIAPYSSMVFLLTLCKKY